MQGGGLQKGGPSSPFLFQTALSFRQSLDKIPFMYVHNSLPTYLCISIWVRIFCDTKVSHEDVARASDIYLVIRTVVYVGLSRSSRVKKSSRVKFESSQILIQFSDLESSLIFGFARPLSGRNWVHRNYGGRHKVP